MAHPHWYTPGDWSERIRRALGGRIDLDPCGALPRLDTVRATRSYIYPDDDGLALPWYGNVYCNPPYDRVGVRRFTDKALAEVGRPKAETPIELLVNANELAVERLALLVPLKPSARWWRDLARRADVTVVVPRRIAFIDGTGDGGPNRGATGRGELCVFGWRLAEPEALGGIVVKGFDFSTADKERPTQAGLWDRIAAPHRGAELRGRS